MASEPTAGATPGPARAIRPDRLVRYYRGLLWSYGAGFLFQLAGTAATNQTGETVQAVGSCVLMLGLPLLLAAVVYAGLTAAAYGSRVPVLWALAMLVPCANLLVLLLLSTRAAAACRQVGIPVGLLGPRRAAATGRHERARTPEPVPPPPPPPPLPGRYDDGEHERDFRRDEPDPDRYRRE